MMLTKPTAAVLYPAVIYTLWQRCYRLRFPTLQPFALVFIAAIAPYAAYLWLVAHSRLNEDFHYLFLANQFPHPATLKRWIVDGLFSTHGVLAIDRPLALGTLLLLLASALRPLRSIWRNPLFVAALLTLAGNIFFVFWRNYQPAHYYLFAYIPMAIVVTLSVDTLLRIAPPWPRRLLQCAVTVLIAGGLWKTIQIVRHPQFTLINAAIDLTDYVKRHPSSNPLLLAESGDQISLMAGLPSICDDFGTQPLRVEIVDRRPGWFAAWNSVDPHLLNEIHTQFHLQRVAAYPVMDDPTRNTLVLYRLVPLSLPEQDVAIQPQKLEMQHRPR
jgi:hypothetical protein